MGKFIVSVGLLAVSLGVPFVVEFIGASGVGKTHLLRRLLQLTSGENWQSPESVIQRLRPQNIRLDFNDTELLIMEVWLAHALQAKLKPFDLIFMTDRLYRHMKLHVRLRQTQDDMAMLADEHIFQLYEVAMVDLAARRAQEFKALLPGRAFVHLKRHPQRILLQTRKREREGTYRVGVSTRNDAALLKDIEYKCARIEQLAATLSKNGAPVLTVDMEQPTHDVEQSVLQFMHLQRAAHHAATLHQNQ